MGWIGDNEMGRVLEFYRLGNIFYQSITNADYRKRLIKTMTHPACVLIDEFGEENPDKIIYYIHKHSCSGFFALWRFTLASLDFADEMSFTPYISWAGQPLLSEREFINGSQNPFEYYFKQPEEISFDSVRASKRVIDAEGSSNRTAHPIHPDYDLYNDINRFKRLVYLQKKYIKVNDEINRKLEKDYNGLVNESSVIGVHVRGTDFNLELKDHPAKVSLRQYIHEVRKIAKKTGIHKVFLATDDSCVLKKFRQEFGDKLLLYPDTQRTSAHVGVHFLNNHRKHHHYLLGYEVLRDAYTLSRAKAFVGGVSNVSLAARVFAEAAEHDFEECKILYNGTGRNDFQHKIRQKKYDLLRKKYEIKYKNRGV